MATYLSGLFFLPLLVSLLLLILPKNLGKPLVIGAAVALSVLSLTAFSNLSGVQYITAPDYVNQLVFVLDLLLLCFFGWVAIQKKSLWVGLLSIVQLGGLIYLFFNLPHSQSAQLMVDELSGFMFILINVISSIIAIFSLKYIDQEDCSPFRRKYFLSIIFWFIAAMNLVVSSDNLEYFFLFFELTTLASYLLISFRKDDVSEKNAVTALWMNQIGGVALLGSIFYIHFNQLGDITFSNLMANAGTKGILLPLAFISMAALIKGAQMPFSKWLLGAMVAPTPVSALLHSSTMVKIAPFVILRLSPALKDTSLAMVIIGLTAFVFVAAAIGALAQDNFKRILAHSTIALLALMIMMAALGTPTTTIAALILILFHGISKSMLFLNAGVLEKVFHMKGTSDMDRLSETGPFTALVMIIGFMSLLLPPFGAFIGKWLSIETLGGFAIESKLLGALTIVAVAFGGAILTLLYFKVIGVLINRSGESDKISFEKTGVIYKATMYILLGIITISILGLPWLLTQYFAPVSEAIIQQAAAVTPEGWNISIGSVSLPIVPLAIAFLMLPATLLTAMFIRFKNVDRAKEYMCGEKVNYSFGSFYFSTEVATPYFYSIGVAFFMAMLVVSLL
jgi:ech hydrogenase subunit A